MFPYFLIGLFIGLVAGAIGVKVLKRSPCGYLRVDHSDPSDPPLLFLELQTSVEHITKQKEVTFNVKVEDFVPHN